MNLSKKVVFLNVVFYLAVGFLVLHGALDAWLITGLPIFFLTLLVSYLVTQARTQNPKQIGFRVAILLVSICLIGFFSLGSYFEAAFFPLSKPIEDGNILRIKKLVERRPDLLDMGAGDKLASPPLTKAVYRNDLEMVRLLLDLGADIESRGPAGVADPALYVAAEIGDFEILKFLLHRGADPNSMGNIDRRPLHCAAERGDLRIAELLLQRGADINAQDNYYGKTPLDCAVEKKKDNAVEFLLAKGATTGESLGAPIHLAASRGDVMRVQELLELGGNPNLRNGKKWTPLHEAAYTQTWRTKETIKVLLDAGADPSLEDVDGRTPLEMNPDAKAFIQSYLEEKGSIDASANQ